ncbi:MAG: response regulator [bacterium]
MNEHSTIRVLIAEGSTQARINLKKLLFNVADEVEVVAEIDKTEDVVASAIKTRPDIIFLNIALEGEEGGMKLTEGLVEEIPEVGLIIISDQELSSQQIQEAMLAGARGLLTQPISQEKLAGTLRRIVKIQEKEREYIKAAPSALPPEARHKIVTLFSTKGGSGGTLLSVNLAVMLAKMLQEGGEKVALLDLDLQFGDCAVMLNLTPTRTIAGLVKEISEQGRLEEGLLESYLIKHDSGLRLLAAPLKPEQAELVNGAHIEEIINVLKLNYNFIIIDSPKYLHDSLIAAFNLSNLILFVFTLDLPAIKNARLGLDIVESLGFKDKVSLVLNRTETHMGITPPEVEEALDYPILGHIPSDGRRIIPSINEGVPFVLGYEKEKVTERIEELASKIIGGEEGAQKKKGWIKQFFTSKK